MNRQKTIAAATGLLLLPAGAVLAMNLDLATAQDHPAQVRGATTVHMMPTARSENSGIFKLSPSISSGSTTTEPDDTATDHDDTTTSTSTTSSTTATASTTTITMGTTNTTEPDDRNEAAENEPAEKASPDDSPTTMSPGTSTTVPGHPDDHPEGQGGNQANGSNGGTGSPHD